MSSICTHTHTHTHSLSLSHTHTRNLSTSVGVMYVNIHTYACMYTLMYVYIYICTCTYLQEMARGRKVQLFSVDNTSQGLLRFSFRHTLSHTHKNARAHTQIICTYTYIHTYSWKGDLTNLKMPHMQSMRRSTQFLPMKCSSSACVAPA